MQRKRGGERDARLHSDGCVFRRIGGQPSRQVLCPAVGDRTPGIMSTISEGLQAVTARIAAAAAAAGRAPEAIQLVAVSKTFSPESIRAAFNAGQRAFGESYVQEALVKINGLRALPLEWHFIGPIQSNKTKAIAENFHWVHGVDRLRIAQRLSEARPAGLEPLQVCLQVNVSGEASKSGRAPEELAELAAQVSALPRLRLRGLMTIPRPSDDPSVQTSCVPAAGGPAAPTVRPGDPARHPVHGHVGGSRGGYPRRCNHRACGSRYLR